MWDHADSMKETFVHQLQHAASDAKALVKWLVLAVLVGVPCGLVGTAFHLSVDFVTELRGEYPWLLFGMPLAGLAIVALYKATQSVGVGTNDIIEAVQSGKKLRLWLVPAIFCSTVLTQLVGGSGGREGAALQMGGAIGYRVGNLIRLSDHDRRTATLCGMAAFFSALFGTPLAATVFALTVVDVGITFYGAFLPGFAAALVAYGVSLGCGVPPTRFAVTAPAFDWSLAVRVALLGIACAWVTILFCNVLHFMEHLMSDWLPNLWARTAVGGTMLLVFSLLIGQGRYNGTGLSLIVAAVEQGEALPLDFLAKICFTALTLASCFKGGEVVPSFCIGATFGCVVGPLLGIPAGFAAALGLAGVFCGATNCLLATVLLAIELFGADGLLYFAIVCGMSYALSGYAGLYSSQTILTDKLSSEYHHA